MDLDTLAYAMLGLSLLASAVKMGSWILHSDPRAIINAGRWALLALIGLAVALLVWLVTSGRYAYAMMLAAFMLPVLVQARPALARLPRSTQRRAKRISSHLLMNYSNNLNGLVGNIPLFHVAYVARNSHAFPMALNGCRRLHAT